MKKAICAFLSILLISISANATEFAGDITAKSVALYDSNGNMLYEQNATEQLQPASVTKIMTMLLVMEAVDRGDVLLSDMITGSTYAESMGGTQIWLKAGEQLTLDEMMKAIAVGSANDCSVAVAEHLAGTESAFVEKMNIRAKEIGCTDTEFINANGLDTNGNKTLTTARDLAIISAELLKHEKILDYTGIWMDTIRNGEFSLANTNKMLKTYDGMIGLKTGYISEAGFCISAVATRDDMTLIATVMAAPTKEDRISDVTALLNYGFANYTAYTPDISQIPNTIAVNLGKKEVISIKSVTNGSFTIEKDKESTIETQINLTESVDAPVVEGQKLGEVYIKTADKIITTIPIIAGETVEKKGILDILMDLIDEIVA